MSTDDKNLDQNGGDAGSGGGEPITFTPEQQAQVNKILQTRLAREQAKYATEKETLTKSVQTMQEELDALKKANESSDKKHKDKSVEEIDAIRAENEEVKRVHKNLKDEIDRIKQIAAKANQDKEVAEKAKVEALRDFAITRAAEKQGFVDIDLVVKVTQGNIALDPETGKWTVYVDGTPKLNASMEPMTLEDFYKEYAANHPYLVRGDMKGGAGSSESNRSNISGARTVQPKDIFGPGSNSQLAMQVKREDPRKYTALKDMARKDGLIA